MRVGRGTGHLEAQRTLHGWVGIGPSSAVEALRAVGGPKEAQENARKPLCLYTFINGQL